MFWLWLIVTCVLIGVGSYVIGMIDGPDDRIGLFWVVFIGSWLWPLVLTAIIIFGPFYGLFWLGDRKRQQRRLEQDKRSDK